MTTTTVQTRYFAMGQAERIGTAAAELGLGLRLLTHAFRRALRRPVRPAAASLNACLEANKVRRLAQSYLRSDPGFASDLYAAADRHEMINGA